jgi:S1-C subfamily serine protease
LNNSLQHIDSDFILNIDLKDYFYAFHFGRVRGYFMNGPFKFSNEVSTILARLFTFDDVLPMGSPTSPILANMITFSLDIDLINYCNLYNIKYSRYADDLTFSTSKSNLPKGFLYLNENKYVVGKTIEKIIKKQSFEINDKKTYIARKYNRQIVTGLITNKKPNLPNEVIKRVRAILYNTIKDGIESQVRKMYNLNDKDDYNQYINSFYNHLRGLLNYISMIRGKDDLLFQKYANEFNLIYGEDIFDCENFLGDTVYNENRIVVITEETTGSQGTGFFIKYNHETYLVTATHVIREDPNNIWFFHHNVKHVKRKLEPIEISPINEKTDIVLVKIKHNKYYEVIDNYTYKSFENVVLLGYEEYYSKTMVHNSIESVTISKEKNFNVDRCIRIKDNCINHGMSGGPVLNNDKKVIGVNFQGGEMGKSTFVYLDKELIKRLA